ncbi:MAG: (2Fe-2S)-binding protein [Verrucomicrobiae bacterium]|nr:(2Fe-2S)-binding protein [Verrucomicrobiae bacterium]
MNAISDQPVTPSAVRSTVVVCHCLGITEAEINETIDGLLRPSVEAVSEITGAGSACTGCRFRIERLIRGESPLCGRFSLCADCGSCRAICICQPEETETISPCISPADCSEITRS